MKHLVLVDFVCKESDVYFASGSFFESDKLDRVKELEKQGFIKANEKLSTLEEVKQEEEKKAPVKRTRKSVKK